MQALEEYFDNLYPIHIRLLKLTSLGPGSNQSVSGFFLEFLRLANDANISKILKNRLLLAPSAQTRNSAQSSSGIQPL